MKKKLLFVFLFSIQLLTFSQQKFPFNDPKFPIEQRVDDLVSRLTLEEKITQMVYNSPAITRLDIPAYNWWNEGLHGIARNGIATVFPQAIGLAAMWDTNFMLKVAAVISDEARAKYNLAAAKNKRGIYQGITLWSPNINLFRDPRWGRGMETYGEDTYLTGEMGKQFVIGLQGNDEKYLKTIATPKHFAVHSGPEPERHSFNALISDYDLRESFLPHFKKCIVDGKAYSVMCAYNRFRGDACCGSDPLLKQILRDEWGFKGYIVSDCWAVSDIYEYHKIVKTSEEASAISVKAGTDLECGSSYPSLIKAIKQGLIKEEEIDVAVKRLFTARFKLGMFDPPEDVPYSKLREVDTKENKQIALEAARKSIVLLKNDKNLLPLKKDLKTIAVIGPNANDVEVLLGNYNGFPSSPVTPLQGIKEKLPNTEVLYARGCELAENLPSFEVIGEEFLFTDKAGVEKGLHGEYFNNREMNGTPTFSRIDKTIDFAWWDDAPHQSFDTDNFGIRWTGYLKPPKTGKFALGGYGFNAFKIFINDSLFVSYSGEHEPSKTYKFVNLSAGNTYKIKIEFRKRMRYSFMQFLWSKPEENLELSAIEAAKKSDAVIMFMGLSPRLEGEEMKVEVKGFKGGDRLTLDLPETQSNLIKKIHALKKPVVLVLLNGSAVSISWESKNIPAIIEAWYPGQAAGSAIADVIFGDYNPGGKLPVTFYKSVNQLPPFSNYDMNGRTYRYFKGEPLYPFGFGLSYTNFTYKNLNITRKQISDCDSTVLSVEITNAGKVKGEEVVQLYVKGEKDVRANKTLKGFKRVALLPGETKKVEFTITPETLSRWIDGKGFSVEKDSYNLMVGTSSDSKNLHKTRLIVK